MNGPSINGVKQWPRESRPREKLLQRGPGALSDGELLALLLRTGIAGKNVLTLAEELLQRFGGVNGLLHTGADALRQIKGLGPAKRTVVIAVLELARRALAEDLKAKAVFESPRAAREYLQLQLGARPHEVFAVMFLDSQNRLIAMEDMFRGTLTQATVYPREIVVRALHHHAAAVVLAHNHPSGNAEPSLADVELTRTVMTALALVDVRVLDHFVVTRETAVSMAQQGLM
ncbi:MAG: DNA repair protein RadC [Hydrogenophaga sp.]|jgi:DNA repair protein RadC|uniref:RadC family protein n=1 Tax=Hydrogenophaga sp. TaxID=1904254 RepID=UPI0026248229|nr:DNA repair protein RadC [Hydrogenophaga sp.]MCW5669347.1 DNA repair protein RadC [Hydrogenophaga sp.]